MTHPSRELDIALVHGDLTSGQELVLVNASNTNVALGSGVSGAIRRTCGTAYQDHIKQALEQTFGGPMAPGEVLITDAGIHPIARYVAHVAVMDYRRGFSASSFPSKELIAQALERLWVALESIPEPSLSVAMVALGAGTGQLGVRFPTNAACDTLLAHRAARPDSRIHKVVFYGYGLPDYLVMAEVLSACLPGFRATLPVEIQKHIAAVTRDEN